MYKVNKEDYSMNDITKIKVDGEPESSYQLYPRNEEFAKRAGGGNGGANVQSDWNQNDETAPDYVKNRPFYTGDRVQTVFVEESTASFSFSNDDGMYTGLFPSTFDATVGDTYKVYWDGSTYECTCVDFFGNSAIGNLSIVGRGADTGEPFIMVLIETEIYIYTADTSASHTFSISGFVQELVKIDEKYLPEYSVLYSGDPANWSNAKKQQMYDDFISGKLVLYNYSETANLVLSVFYSTTAGLKFVFFEGYRYLRSFVRNAFSNPIELTESGINHLIENQINNLTRWKLYSANYSEVSVGDLLSMYVAFDSTTNKACIFTDTKSDIGTEVVNSTIVTNGDSDIVLSSSTSGSSKKFKITVDDSGTLTATEVT